MNGVGGGFLLDGQSGVLILEEGGKINHQCFKYIYTICICITGTRISSQFTFIVYDIYILYMYIYTGYLRGKKITVFLNLNLCIYKYMNNEYVNIKINMYIYVHILYIYIYNMYMYNKNKNLISVYIYIVRYIHIVYTVF